MVHLMGPLVSPCTTFLDPLIVSKTRWISDFHNFLSPWSLLVLHVHAFSPIWWNWNRRAYFPHTSVLEDKQWDSNLGCLDHLFWNIDDMICFLSTNIFAPVVTSFTYLSSLLLVFRYLVISLNLNLQMFEMYRFGTEMREMCTFEVKYK